MRKILLTLLALGFVLVSWAQDRTISGRVTSIEDGTALPGVNVLLKGTTHGSVTDADGNYHLAVPQQGGTLVFTFIGLKATEVEIGSRSVVDVPMANDITQLSEVVVVAYGTQEKKSLTGAISSVKSDAFRNQPVLGLDQAMQGRLAGVQVTQNSGSPGSSIQVRVRGSSSLSGSNEPLYVIDGIPINTGSYSQIGVGNQSVSALNDINPSDIESIEVLKDAASASLYGSRGANGVVLITTKRGKSSKTQINFNSYWGTQSPWKVVDLISGPDFVRLQTDALVNRYGVGAGTTTNPEGVVNANGSVTVNGATFGLPAGSQTFRSPGDMAAFFWRPSTTNVLATLNPSTGFYETSLAPGIDPLEIRDPGFFLNPNSSPNTDWMDKIFHSAPIANYDLSMTGGNENTKFLVSGGYFKQDGIIIGSGFERGSARVNIDNKVNDKFSFGTSTSFARSINTRLNNDNNIYGVLSTAVLTASDIPAYLASGAYAFDPSNSTDNPVAQAKEPFNKAESNRLIGNIYGEYAFNDHLSLRTSLGIDFLYFAENRFIPTTVRQGQPTGQGNANTSQELNWLNENVLRYNKTFGQNHTVDFLVGASFQESKFYSTAASATGFPFNSLSVLNAGSNKTNASSTGTSWALVSYFARANYSYKGKYIFSATFRRDGSSRFGANSRYGNFPSISAGWNIHEEDFFSGMNSTINNLKLRASYGVTGNQEIGNFTYAGLYGINTNYIQQGGTAPTQLQNPNLSWEQTGQFDGGLEIGLFNKVNITVDYYIKNTTELLLNRPILAVSGFNTISQNIGKMQNKGFEIGLNATPVTTASGFSWTTDFNISFNRNKVTSLSKDVLPFASGFASWVQEGQPLGTFRGYKVEGIFQTQEDINTVNAQAAAQNGAGTFYQSSLTRPGDFKFADLLTVDTNGDGTPDASDGKITSDDQQIIGNAQPKFIGGWSNTFNFKGIDFSFFIQFVEGNKVWNHNRLFAEGMNSIFGQYASVNNRWTPSNVNTSIPRAVYGDPNTNRRNSDHWLEDGSYARMKNIVLGYTLPRALTGKIGLSKLRIYTAAQNLFTVTNYGGFDPEVSTFTAAASGNTTANAAPGTDFLTYPQAKTITIGINATFK
jgi:TonB-linked SusC/RagA family outer membrane protein